MTNLRPYTPKEKKERILNRQTLELSIVGLCLTLAAFPYLGTVRESLSFSTELKQSSLQIDFDTKKEQLEIEKERTRRSAQQCLQLFTVDTKTGESVPSEGITESTSIKSTKMLVPGTLVCFSGGATAFVDRTGQGFEKVIPAKPTNNKQENNAKAMEGI